MRRARYLSLLVVVAAAALAAGLVVSKLIRDPAGDDPLAQALPSLSGPARALADWQGVPRVVNFWATWCAPCREEIPVLNGIQAEWPGRLQVIGVAVDEREPVQAFAREVPLEYPVLLAPRQGGALMRKLGNPEGVLPYSVILDADGRIVATRAGPYTRESLRAELASLP